MQELYVMQSNLNQMQQVEHIMKAEDPSFQLNHELIKLDQYL